MSTPSTYTTTGRDIRNQAHRAWLPLVLCVLFVATLLAVPSAAVAATAHADAGDPAHINPDCDACHKPHQAPTERSLLSGVTESEVCYVCHGDPLSGSDWNVETGANSFTGMASGHELEDATDPDATVDLTDSCTGCHGVHGDPDVRANLPANEQVAGATIDAADPRTWCLACHNADHAWYSGSETAGVYSFDAGLKAAYEALIQNPTLDASYFPTLGTFPGSTSNATYLASTHATGIDSGTVESLVSVTTETVTRVQGDCLWCHASHRSTATHDGLLGEYRASTPDDVAGGITEAEYAQACFECHGNSSGTVYLPAANYEDADWLAIGAPDVYSLVTDDTGNPDRTGHQIRSSGGYYDVDSPLPCYECHNPHGSKNGNSVMISDALGGNLNPRGTAAQVRQFCFSCHTTGDGTPSGWDSDSNNNGVHDDGAYTTTLSNTAVGTTVVGISRTAAEPMHLSSSSYHTLAGSQSCLGCHDDAHNPGGGASSGGKDCYICHSTYMDYMEDGTDRDTSDTESGVGSSNTAQYHHVMGSATKDGDEAVGGTDANNFTNYPAAGTDVYCVSCHVDHDKFNSSKSSSLRTSIGASTEAPASVTAASTDFNATTGGVCLGCHYVSRTKGTEQKSDGTTVTPAIPHTSASAVAAGAVYDASAHQYQVAGRQRSDSTTFAGDCSKCHSDRLAGTYYKSATTGPEFGLHYDPSRRILEALGRGSVADPYAEERFCYSCHSITTNGFKGTVNRDWYGAAGAAMDAASQAVYGQFQLTYGHKPGSYTGVHKPASVDEVSGGTLTVAKHVECADCHSPHAAGATNHVTTQGNNRTNVIPSAGSPVSGVWGVEPTYPNTNPFVVPSSYTQVASSTKEYQICFKCHSSYNANLTSWDPAAPNDWTNVALDFNPNNRSYHPVMAPRGAALALSASWMDAAWQRVGTQTMYCSDCHGAASTDPAALGPHGSSRPRNLKAYWPIYPGADGVLGTGDDAPYNLNGVNDGTQPGNMCDECHTSFLTQAAHTVNNNHKSNPCYYCHIVVPHGGALHRLIGDRDSSMPVRYAYNSDKTNLRIRAYTRNSDGDGTVVEAADCTTFTGCNPNAHNTTPTSLNNW